MKKNKLTITINKPIVEVFEFTTNPKNTHLWIASIAQEVASQYPPKIGTEYKNRGEDTAWDTYKVTEHEKDRLFTLADMKDNYHVRYTYKRVNDNITEMEYFEWMEDGELGNPFTQAVLEKLKKIVEKQ